MTYDIWFKVAELLMSALAAAGTGALAISTFRLSMRTKAMAEGEQQARAQADAARLQDDLHHRQQLSGVIVMDECWIKQTLEHFGDSRTRLMAIGQLTRKPRNVGNGPALNVTLFLILPNESTHGGVRLLGTLQPGYEPTEYLELFRAEADASADWDANHCNWEGATLEIAYNNIFGENFRSKFYLTGKRELENRETDFYFVGDQININAPYMMQSRLSPAPPQQSNLVAPSLSDT